jgi:hypothetical protein
VGLDESVLDDIERVVLVAKHAERERIGPSMIALEERPESIAISAASGGDQLVVIDGVTSGGRSLALLIHASGVISSESPGCRDGPVALC